MDTVKVVFFDADETLLSVFPSVAHHYHEIALRHGLPSDEARVGDALKRVWRSLLPAYENRPNGFRTFPAREQAFWEEYVRRVFITAFNLVPTQDVISEVYSRFAQASTRRIADGALDAIAAIRRSGTFVGLFTNNDRRIHALVKDLGIDDLFDVVLSSGDVGAKKPAPEAFASMQAVSKLPARNSLFVGNSVEHDYLGARACGWQAILYQPSPVSFSVDSEVHSVRTFSELPALVLR